MYSCWFVLFYNQMGFGWLVGTHDKPAQETITAAVMHLFATELQRPPPEFNQQPH